MNSAAQRLLIRIWNTNPLVFVGAVLLLQVIFFFPQLINFTAIDMNFSRGEYFIFRFYILLPTVLLVMGLAYIQNTTYALQSRAGMRNSNLYHLIAAVGASLAFFWSLQLLWKNKLTLILLAPYIFATVIATVHGNKLSIRIEKMLGIYVEELKGKPQFLKLWPSVAVLMAFLIYQVIDLGTEGVPVTTSTGKVLTLGIDTLTLLVVLGIAGNFSFSLLRTARSSDSYWFHTLAFVLNMCIDFIKFAILVKFDLNWQLFLPVTTGSVIGSLIGANLALSIAAKIQAKFDIHVLKPKEMQELEQSHAIAWPSLQIKWLALVFVVQIAAIIWGVADAFTTASLAFLSAWQQMSFTLKSRAGQRNNSLYLGWSSVFSNGVWFITLVPLAIGGVTMDKAIPYIIGGAIGSLLGQLAGMHAERAIGALANTPPNPTPKLATS